MVRFFKKTALKAFLRDCVGATGVLLLLVAGIANAQTGTTTYVTCVTEMEPLSGIRMCSPETAGQWCSAGLRCIQSVNGCICG